MTSNKTTNDLKKGQLVILNNRWQARIEDNKRGNIRMATVYGDFEEMGSIYAHDIFAYRENDKWIPVQHTPEQIKLRQDVEHFFS